MYGKKRLFTSEPDLFHDAGVCYFKYSTRNPGKSVDPVVIERPLTGQPHKGKVLAVIHWCPDGLWVREVIGG